MTSAASALSVPPGLVAGDRVAVVAPSGPVDPGRLERGLDLLRAWGFRPVTGRHVRDRDPDLPYLAGREADRVADLQWALTEPGLAAVWCARGGYGAGRLVDLLDWEAIASAEPRLLVGSSDVTALHLAVSGRLRRVSLFGPMVASALLTEDGGEPRSREHALAAVRDPARFPPVGGSDAATVVPGRASGVLRGGTLSLLASAAGTPDAPSFRDAVLLLEDVGESPHRLDRMLEQLLRSGALDGVRGIALGSFQDCGATGESVVVRRLRELEVPTARGFDLGHGPVQLTVTLGVEVELDADGRWLMPADS